MDYSKLSDLEINNLVDGHIYKDPSEVPDTDYCNNPADAWPIIVANFISLQFMHGNWMASVNPSQEAGYRSACFIEKKKPLRAAMIVFLMMQESQHA
ncbi:phage protein NinX family protein [Cronobacter dublinensis]|uniref:phage protein NinX family protein n=1 Tax=Cronobacter dublinensis TaxID=413497 RepID=UPI000576AE10|nr:phage protein NinX family protein [Cronobacter dublinensis]